MGRLIPKPLRDEVIATYGRTCHLCTFPIRDDEQLTIDHVVPRAMHGRTELANLRPAHFSCNQAKGAMVPDEPVYTRSLVNHLRRWQGRKGRRIRR